MSESDTQTNETNFLTGFAKLCTGTEIPPLFAAWSGISGISCALGRRCWVDMGTFQIYPNMYIVLVGGSGRVRKSTTITMVERLIRKLEPKPNLIAQKITPEALIDSMKLYVHVQKEKQILEFADRCEGFVIVDELSNFLNKNTYEAGLASLLIPFYDCKDDWDYKTKGGGTTHLTNTCLGLLGASTPDWITNAIPETAVGGGLTSRIIFIYVKDPAPPVPRPTWGKEKVELQESLQRALQRIACLEGEFKLDSEAIELYDKEYRSFRTSKDALRWSEDPALTGYASRRHLHYTKVAMVFSASERADRVITARHLDGAITLIRQSEATMPMLISLITSTAQGNIIEFVHTRIRQSDKGRVTRPKLLQAVGHKIGAREMDAVIDTLIASHKIRQEVRDNTMWYINTFEKGSD
jgi:hypothetical protein